MENILYEINGIKYVLVEQLLMERNQEKVNKILKKHECVLQGIKEINRGGWFENAYMVFKILVPEKNLIAFNNEE